MTVTPSRNIRIPDDEWEAAKRAAAERHETTSALIRRGLRREVRAPMARAGVEQALEEVTAAWKSAGEATDRFRDVACEVLGLDENPGDDVLVERLRALHGKTGPEPRRWRDFLTGAIAEVERSGARWSHDALREYVEEET